MWHLKFKLKHNNCIYTPKTKEFLIRDSMYPLGRFTNKNFQFLTAIHILEGKEENKRKFINYLKKCKKVVKLEISENLIFTLVKEGKNVSEEFKLVYNSELFLTTPTINDLDGFEYWDVSSWNRKPLEQIIIKSKSSNIINYFEVLSFTEKKLDEVYVMKLFPKLSIKQRETIELAVKEGYYAFPKKTNLEKLSKIMKVSKSATHEFLSKAEGKLIPFLIRK